MIGAIIRAKQQVDQMWRCVTFYFDFGVLRIFPQNFPGVKLSFQFVTSLECSYYFREILEEKCIGKS